MHSVGDIALNLSIRKVNVNKVNIFLWNGINFSRELFFSMYTFIILTMLKMLRRTIKVFYIYIYIA